MLLMAQDRKRRSRMLPGDPPDNRLFPTA